MGRGRIALTAIAVIGALGVASGSEPVAAQQLSERSVRTIMDYAWVYTPDKFTPPSGKTVFIDKKNKAKMIVPVDMARQVIMAGRLTAHAQICDLPDDQVRNWHSLMLRAQRSKKWSPQQMVYINQLHLVTVMMLVGKLQIVEYKGKKKVSVRPAKSKVGTCTAEQREKVKELIAAYVKSGPDITRSMRPPTKTGTVPTSNKK